MPQTDGHCVWHGVCYNEDKIKNCAYDGPAKPLDASGVDALKQWCSHLLPHNYTEGHDVLTCCDNQQVSWLDSLTSLNDYTPIVTISWSCSTTTSNWLRTFSTGVHRAWTIWCDTSASSRVARTSRRSSTSLKSKQTPKITVSSSSSVLKVNVV